MSEIFEALNEFERKAMESLIEEIRVTERKRAENGVQKYISDAVHEKLYELWDAFNYCYRTMSVDEYEKCFGNSEPLDLSPEEFIEKINNYISKKNEDNSKDIIWKRISDDWSIVTL